MKRYKATTRKEIRAIKASIRHWQEDAITIGSSGIQQFNRMSGEDCSLCEAFRKACWLCPLDKAGLACNNADSPYQQWCNAKVPEAEAAANDMIYALKSLLPKEERKGRYK